MDNVNLLLSTIISRCQLIKLNKKNFDMQATNGVTYNYKVNKFYNYCRNADSISKSYKKDRFEKSLVFVNEVEKRFKKDLEPQEYQVYIDRFWQAMCRVVCSQEIMHARDNKIKYKELVKRLKCVCINDRTEKTLKSYPLKKLPLSQRVFAYAMKYRLYFLLKVLVGLRSR